MCTCGNEGQGNVYVCQHLDSVSALTCGVVVMVSLGIGVQFLPWNTNHCVTPGNKLCQNITWDNSHQKQFWIISPVFNTRCGCYYRRLSSDMTFCVQRILGLYMDVCVLQCVVGTLSDILHCVQGFSVIQNIYCFRPFHIYQRTLWFADQEIFYTMLAHPPSMAQSPCYFTVSYSVTIRSNEIRNLWIKTEISFTLHKCCSHRCTPRTWCRIR